MTSTYTTSNRLEKPATGDYIDSWGEQRNEDLDLIDDALDGVLSLSLTANKTLSTADGSADEARNRIIHVTASDGDYTVTLPTTIKWYFIINDDTSNYITFKVSGGSQTVILAPRTRQTVYADGTELRAMAAPGQWFFLSSSTPTGTGSATITIDRTVFKEWLCIFSGVSHDSGSSQSLEYSANSATAAIAGSIAAASTFSGYIHYRQVGNIGLVKTGHVSGAFSTTAMTMQEWGSSGAFSATFGLSWSGGNFDAGSLTYWAR